MEEELTRGASLSQVLPNLAAILPYDAQGPGLAMVEMAYLGDSIYEFAARLHVLNSYHGCKISRLHKEVVSLVNCKFQSDMLALIQDELTQEESEIVRKARNGSGKGPRNARPADYSRATGVESLIGYLFLAGAYDRLSYLLNKVLDHTKN